MQDLISALEKTLELLARSEDSVWSNMSVIEARDILTAQLRSLKETKNLKFFRQGEIRFLYLPTGALQDIAIDNGWGDEFVKIAETIDQYT